MAGLRELTTDAKRLYEALDYLLEKQDSENTEEMDFKEIWFSAKSRPFMQHILGTKDELIRRRYLTILSSLISLTNNTNKKTMQVRFLARILAACSESNLELKELITDGMLLQEKSIDEFQEIKNEDLQIGLLVDLFLLAYLDGEPEEKQLDYSIGFMSILGLKQETAKAVGVVVKALLEQDDKTVMKQSQFFNIANVYCYMKNPPDGILVSDIEKAKKVKAEKIIFIGIAWKAIPLINCDDFYADKIDFVSCIFESIQGVFNKNKKVCFRECQFMNSEVEENFITMKNTIIDKCEFSDIKSLDCKEKHLIQLSASEIYDSKFIDIKINHNCQNPFGGFLRTYNCKIKNITVQSLTTVSSSSARYRRVIDIYGGWVVKCDFLDCSLSEDSYLFTDSDKTVKSHLVVERLKSNRSWVNEHRSGESMENLEQQMFEEE